MLLTLLPLAAFFCLGFVTQLAENLRRVFCHTHAAHHSVEHLYWFAGNRASPVQHFNHANISWRLGKLEWLFVTPRYHFVHHGTDRRLNDSNFSFLLTIWDRVFGTYTNPNEVEENFQLGLNYDVGVGRLFIGLGPKAPNAAP